MRILVLRPAGEGRRVGRALQRLGHEPVLVPLIEIRPRRLNFVLRPAFDFSVVTSANAIAAVAGLAPSWLTAAPLYCVGERCATRARRAGFASIVGCEPTAAELARRISGDGGRGSRALYLAGQPRKPDLEVALAQAGVEVETVETYEAVPVDSIDASAILELGRGIDAVLHFSHASAAAALRVLQQSTSSRHFAAARQLCLSADVATAFHDHPDWRIEIAQRPDLKAMLDLIGTGASARAP